MPPGMSMSSEQGEYIVVLRVRSSAKFLPEEGWEIVLDVPNLNLKGIRVRTFTRWAVEGGKELPRELIVEVRGRADALDEAVGKFGLIARPLATMIGFVANVRVDPLQEHLAYECTPNREERQFIETFLPDERGAVSEGRFIRRHLLEAACRALMCVAVDQARLDRALRQYELALREWHVGSEWLTLSHLWVAAENLTKAVIRKTVAERGTSEEDLAHCYKLVTDDPGRPRWQSLLGASVRQDIIFMGDNDTYQTAKEASDGLEHGYLALDKIAAHALTCTDRTFYYIRRAILDLLRLPDEVMAELMEITPKDVQPPLKVARGRLIGDADDLAVDGELYPRLEWSSGIDGVVREGSAFQFKTTDKMTIRTHPDIGFQLDRLEVHGSLQDGQVPVQLTDQDVTVKHTPASPSERLVSSVMPLVDAAADTGAERAHTPPSMYAFNMFGQAVSFFQSAQVLINARQPVEALPALRSLTILAARFEQMTEPAGPGLGVAVRAVVDAIEALGADADVTEARRRDILAAAETHGIAVPDKLARFDTTSAYTGLGYEMMLATDAANGGYGATHLHMQWIDSEHAGFQVALEPGPLIDLVSTAAVIAALGLLKHAASLFEWTLSVGKVDGLLEEARAVNASAALSLQPPAAP